MVIQNGYADPVPSSAPAFFEWGGESWFYNKRARYYYNRDGMLLHRAVWISVHGVIPEGYEIHHIDRSRSNNSLSNLELLTISDHRRLTALQRDDDAWTRHQTPEAVRDRLRAYWQRREPRPVICDMCGSTFLSTGMRAKRCSDDCRRESARRYGASGRAARRAGDQPR